MGAVGLLERVFGRFRSAGAAITEVAVPDPLILGGREPLEVVGASQHQDALRRCVAEGQEGSGCRNVQAVLVPEQTDPNDGKAIQVQIDGKVVGHLAQKDAAVYLPGLLALIELHGRPIGLRGVVAGGVPGPNSVGTLDVTLDHDPADFGLGEWI